MVSEKRRVFIVVSNSWFFNDEFTTHGDDRPLKAFSRRSDANAYLERLRQRERMQDNGEDPGGHNYNVIEMDIEG